MEAFESKKHFLLRNLRWTHYLPSQPSTTSYPSDLGGSDQCCVSPLVIHGMAVEHDELRHPGVGHEDWQEAHPKVFTECGKPV